jgi:glycosyltransferase involved in cell wall biosynthesis
MINIISSFGSRPANRGPGKVYSNLVNGLDRIGYPYVINRDLSATKRLWIHDSVTALYDIGRSDASTVIGPNLFVLPSEIPAAVDLRQVLYLHPAAWTRHMWEHLGFRACPIEIWPVGVDTDTFSPAPKPPLATSILVYHKRRDIRELHEILRVLDDMHLSHVEFNYGHYGEAAYLEAVRSASFILWHGSHESQGLALQEAMACNVPILVCDVNSVFDSRDAFPFPVAVRAIPVSAAPYFDGRCGMKLTDLSRLRTSIEAMLTGLQDFAPRAYVLENLSLAGQARKFVALWDRWGLTFDQGLLEHATSERKWQMSFGARIRKTLDAGAARWPPRKSPG